MLKANEDDYENDYENNSELSYEQQHDNYDQDHDSSAVNGIKEVKDFFQMHGMFFCSTCKNLMDPSKTKGEILEFKCRRCGPKPISFKDRKFEKSMIMSRSLQSTSRKTELETSSIFDKSMPIMSVKCPECFYDEAVYTVVPEEGERRIVMMLICARGAQDSIVKCGHKWNLDQDTEIDYNHKGGALKVKNDIIEEED